MINWVEKIPNKARKVNGIRISLVRSPQTKGDKKLLRISFSESALDGFTRSEYIAVGVDEDDGKIYFTCSDENFGYKLGSKYGKGSRYLHIALKDDVAKQVSKHIGEWELFKSERYQGYYYVDPYTTKGI